MKGETTTPKSRTHDRPRLDFEKCIFMTYSQRQRGRKAPFSSGKRDIGRESRGGGTAVFIGVMDGRGRYAVEK